MEDSLILDGVKYVSSKQASGITGYAKDYIGQMCRAGKIDAKLVGRSWYVSERSLIHHQEQNRGERRADNKADLKRGEELLGRVHISHERDIPLYHVEVDERPLNPEPRKEIQIKRDTVELKSVSTHAEEHTVVRKRAIPNISARTSGITDHPHRSSIDRKEAEPKARKGVGKLAFAVAMLIVILASVLLESELMYTAGAERTQTALSIVYQEDIQTFIINALNAF